LLRASFLQSRCVLRTQRWRPAWVSRGSSAPPSNTCRLLARDHAAPETTLALTKAAQPCRGRVRPPAWCSRPRNSAALLEGALALAGCAPYASGRDELSKLWAGEPA